MLDFLKLLFTWWNGQTFGLRWAISRHGELVGQDEFGNKYYRAPSKIPASIAEHRWVVYNGYAEASMIPPGWHGWMHHKVDVVPDGSYKPRAWEKPHLPDLTGGPGAYRPQGSIIGHAKPEPVQPDYEPWRPA